MNYLPEMFDLSGQAAVVTGGGGLLGKQFCQTLAAAGAAVSVIDIDGESANQVAEEINSQGYQALASPSNISKPDQVVGCGSQDGKAIRQPGYFGEQCCSRPKI